MSNSAQTVIKRTQCWIDKIVIGLNLCPFAKPAFTNGGIEYYVSDKHDNNTQQHLQQLTDCLKQLDNNDSIETSLLIFTVHYKTFDDYLDLLYLANQLLEELDYVGVYQIASFHPDYQFENSAVDDAANFSNRSPYPMLHILRENSIEKAVEHYDNIASVPKNNIKKLQAIGHQEMQNQFTALFRKIP
ncbi:MAG: DUF1415 domain-containing protein [Gammaproteobacteria bacterium]|nr:DUF1415 domain-containing protein [Gammaproteobacteria bacterium]